MLTAESSLEGLAWNHKNYRSLIVSVALTGNGPQKADDPELPATPAETAEEVRRCALLGALVFQLLRPDTFGEPTEDQKLFEETIRLIRDIAPGVLLCMRVKSF